EYDDTAIFANTDTEVTNILYDIARNAQSYGLRINADKIKVLTTKGSLASTASKLSRYKSSSSWVHWCKKRK
uniref:Reverse transcriptase domain-containing protein n=1 Tax=Romanomermis culicivorax TaxID=13658 RepID=A0A915HKY8_ROMCU